MSSYNGEGLLPESHEVNSNVVLKIFHICLMLEVQ